MCAIAILASAESKLLTAEHVHILLDHLPVIEAPPAERTEPHTH